MTNKKQTDNKSNYWFKRRRYGYGWIPVTKEGWGIVAIFLTVLIVGSLAIKDTPDGEFTKEIGIYLMAVAIMTVTLIRISKAKGPKPKWRWGAKPNDNPNEDF